MLIFKVKLLCNLMNDYIIKNIFSYITFIFLLLFSLNISNCLLNPYGHITINNISPQENSLIDTNSRISF